MSIYKRHVHDRLVSISLNKSIYTWVSCANYLYGNLLLKLLYSWVMAHLFTKFLCVVKPVRKSFGPSSSLHLLKLGLLIDK